MYTTKDAPPPPCERCSTPQPSSYWREGNLVVVCLHEGNDEDVLRASALPDRCVICNRVSTETLRCTLLRHSPWIWLLCPFPWLFRLARQAARKVHVDVKVCGRHRHWRLRAVIVGIVGLAVVYCLPDAAGYSIAAVLLNLAKLISLVVFLRALRKRGPISSAKVKGNLAWLRVGRRFARSIPMREARTSLDAATSNTHQTDYAARD